MEPLTSICMEHATPAVFTAPPVNTNVKTGESSKDEHQISIDSRVSYGTDKVSIVKERTPNESGLPRIPKVPTTLRNSQNQKLPQWFKPSVISIGPYHYDDPNVQEAQKLKSLHAEKFIQESNQQKHVLYRKIEKKTPELRKCYDEREISRYGDKALTTMFLLDGCFLLHFINYSSKEDGSNILDFTNHEMAHIKQDLFLLENQLPYQVLELLFKHAKIPRVSMKDMIKRFVASHVPFPRGMSVEGADVQDPCHLLHHLQGVILDKPGTSGRPQKQDEEDKGQKQDKEDKGQKQDKDDTEDKGLGRSKWHSCKNVQELRKVGIHFKPSPTSYLRDISFNTHFGTTGRLKLPAISMNTSTMIIFLNLIAFESSNNTDNLGVISYLCFLDSLIDRWEDVKELQAVGILRNFVGEPGDVAQFFNNVCSKLVPNPSTYKDVMQEIESHIDRHYKSTLRKWYVQCKKKYFSSPWSFIALIAAVIGLLLTGIPAYTSLF